MSTEVKIAKLKEQIAHSIKMVPVFGAEASNLVDNLASTHHLDNRILRAVVYLPISMWAKHSDGKWAVRRVESDLFIFYNLEKGETFKRSRSQARDIGQGLLGQWLLTAAEGL